MLKVRRTQAERSAAAVSQLVDAAATLLSEQGWAKASTSAIATRAGVTTGALHHHFVTKEHLFIAVLDDAADRMVAKLSVLGKETADRGERSTARELLAFLWSFYGDERYWAVWEINMGFRSNNALRAEVQVHRERTSERMIEAVRINHHLDEHTRGRLIEVLPFLLSAIRGIFLETFVGSDEAHIRSQLKVLASTLERLMGPGDLHVSEETLDPV